MATNPMQKKARNAFLLGVVIMLIISALVGVLLFLLVFKDKFEDKKEEGEVTAYVYKLGMDVQSGAQITSDMVVSVETTTKVTPTDSIQSKMDAGNGKLQDMPFSGGMAKVDLTAGTILSHSMLSVGELMQNDIRFAEFNMISLPSLLAPGDYIDVRITMPSGQDFIVVSKKEVVSVDSDTLGLNLTEDEMEMMSCAIIESYKILSTNMYVVQYVEPGTQVASIPTYPINNEVIDLITRNPNIVADAKNAIARRQNPGAGNNDLATLRSQHIDPALREYAEDATENLEEALSEQREKAREARERYLSGLSGY
jgi:hypothetical protein